MAQLPPPPPGLDLYESKVSAILGASISTFAVAIIAVGLRFYARRLCRQPLWWDDWLILVSLLGAATLFFESLCYSVPGGVGRHIWVVPADATYIWAKGLWISEIAYTITLVTAKYSILCFYWKIFKFSKIRTPIFILAGIVTAWGIAVLLVTIFQCVPVNAAWERFKDPTLFDACNVNLNQFFNGNSIPNIITDALIIILPMPFIWQLHLPRSQKIALTNVFILGAIIVGVSITRFIFVVRLNLASPDITWNFIPSQILTTVESNISITCACLPSLRPLLSLVLTGSVERSSAPSNAPAKDRNIAFKNRSWTSKYKNGNDLITKTQDDSEHPFSRMSTSEQGGETEENTRSNTPRSSIPRTNTPRKMVSTQGFDFELEPVRSPRSPGGINVQTEIIVESRPRSRMV